jgi:hypothetical protein
MSWRDEIIRNVIAARDPAPAPIHAPVAAVPAPAAAPAAAPIQPATNYAALWQKVIERESAGVLAQRRAMGL